MGLVAERGTIPLCCSEIMMGRGRVSWSRRSFRYLKNLNERELCYIFESECVHEGCFPWAL